MKILGLDISTKRTGWFITKRSCGVIEPDQSLTFGERLSEFREELDRLLIKYKPDVVVIEDAYYSPGFGNIHTLKTLAKFAGVALELCSQHGIETKIITATKARKYCCKGKEGKITKRDVFDYFIDYYNLEDWSYNKDNDKTDAMCLVWGYRGIKKEEKSSKKKKSKKTSGN